MGNYYNILGLDQGASREAVKIAFRRLARAVHPDFQTTSGDNEQLLHSRQMAQLNEAYSVLYDEEKRRLYDEQLRMQGLLETRQTETRSDTKTASTSTGARTRVRPRPDANPEVVKAFSDQLLVAFLTKYKNLSWKERKLDGFDWALEASSWSSIFWVAHRTFHPVNSVAIKSFLNYAEIAISRKKSHVRSRHFLFLLPFQQLQDWETISEQCQRFVNGESSKAQTAIILLDVQHARALRFANANNQSKQFREVIDWTGARI